ncbi:protein of unknown function [Methylotuvimicrobium alcaliphilum 20Z]|uniref:Uncharacterized protein n=1 Tax=Methylotuvimicrobium alcaliphilum (strain DSM 19304 / NCIMB 14124 / VKM B-2133 / 20Z) TaxID=1091494 RepID=G4STV2_META2|nr:protein of unknown function [Methylotuvimicrobium alcaliphilum 20Z]
MSFISFLLNIPGGISAIGEISKLHLPNKRLDKFSLKKKIASLHAFLFPIKKQFINKSAYCLLK